LATFSSDILATLPLVEEDDGGGGGGGGSAAADTNADAGAT